MNNTIKPITILNKTTKLLAIFLANKSSDWKKWTINPIFLKWRRLVIFQLKTKNFDGTFFLTNETKKSLGRRRDLIFDSVKFNSRKSWILEWVLDEVPHSILMVQNVFRGHFGVLVNCHLFSALSKRAQVEVET